MVVGWRWAGWGCRGLAVALALVAFAHSRARCVCSSDCPLPVSRSGGVTRSVPACRCVRLSVDRCDDKNK